jgi:hypothetical protein
MKLAEELYQAGFLSYPRTETDEFDPGMDLLVRVFGGGGVVVSGVSSYKTTRVESPPAHRKKKRAPQTQALDPSLPPLNTHTSTHSENATQAMVREQANDHRWGDHAAAIAGGAMWKPPRPGTRARFVLCLRGGLFVFYFALSALLEPPRYTSTTTTTTNKSKPNQKQPNQIQTN